MKKALVLMISVFQLTAYAGLDSLVEFHIPAGTGSKPWNTMETKVEVKVGDTLLIINDDSVPHVLHTFGRPCAHQEGQMDPKGGSYKCVIATPADPRIDLLYDHNFGEKARFYVKATN